MNKWSIVFVLVFLPPASDSFARRVYVTPEQKSKLENAQTVLVNVLALTEKGPVDPASLTAVVKRRLEEVGYQTVTDHAQAHDVELLVKCEERKTWAGTTPAGGDAELPDAPARLWQGPACLITYLVDGRDLGWAKEVRPYEESAGDTEPGVKRENDGQSPFLQLKARLEEYDFPVLLMADWGQINRLLTLLESPDTPKIRKLRILSALSEIHAPEALPHLTDLLKHPDLVQETIVALGGLGRESIPLLIDLFESSQLTSIQAAAAKGLGGVAALSGDYRVVPPLHQYLHQTLENFKTVHDLNFSVLTEVVWALGKIPDKRTVQPMEELQSRIWLIYDTSPEMSSLREAVNWSYKQVAEAAVTVQ
jgi:hypothetical protein